jgi:LuxR family transcriptional regulator, positive regulator of biofilm formation
MINLQPEGPARRIRQSLVVILGSPCLFYESLAWLFEKEVAEKCILVPDPGALAREVRTTARRRLLLIDALDRDFEKELGELFALPDWDALSFAVALFNMMNGRSIERRAFMRGVSGFFYRQDSLAVVLKGIDALLQGEAWIPHRLLTELTLGRRNGARPEQEETSLTKRELDVLALIAGGASNEQIGDKLCISPHTVKTHVYNVFKKLQVPNRLQAALWAEKNL